MAGWTKREYTKGQIDRAGSTLVPWWTNEQPIAEADLALGYKIAQNWRTSHAFPLNTFQMVLRNRAARIEKSALVAQRLKRLSSVLGKLAREPAMKLSQMQDLGGCRAIVSNVTAVQRLYSLYREQAVLFEGNAPKTYDYIGEPKPDGYRGIHIVGRYRAQKPVTGPWHGHRIEVQIRSKLQHAYATAVETVTTFTRSPLKFGGGPDDWRRFFSLMGSALALREGTPLVEGTPAREPDLTAELRETANALNVRQRLKKWAESLTQMPRKNLKGAEWWLMVLDVAAGTLEVKGYASRVRAMEAVAQIEKYRRTRELDAVVVSGMSIKYLKTAYPNYYADTMGFLQALTEAIK